MKKNIVLVVASHPDDEILGCGATMARHCNAGDEVHVAILAEGLTSRASQRNVGECEEELSTLKKTAEQANKLLGVTSIQFFNLPDNRMDSVDLIDVVKVVEGLVASISPNIIYTHHIGDVNIDHRVTHEAVVTACRPQPGCKVEKILFFEVASSTEWQTMNTATPFQPNWFVDVSETLDQKIKALQVYESEMRDWPHARSTTALEHLARWRGATIGCRAAEAFILGRSIQY